VGSALGENHPIGPSGAVNPPRRKGAPEMMGALGYPYYLMREADTPPEGK